MNNYWKKRFCQLLSASLLLIRTSLFTIWAQSPPQSRPELITARQGLPQAFVPAIVQDRLGFMWMATRDGLCRYDGHTYRVFQPTPERASLSSSGMADIQTDTSGRFWIMSEQGELDLFDPIRETFVNFSQLPFFQQAFSRQRINKLYVDPTNHLWLKLENSRQLVRINPASHRIRRFPALGPVITVRQDYTGSTWVATKTHLYRLNTETGQFTNWYTKPETYQSRPDTNQDLHVRKDGLMLLLSNQFLTLLHPQQGIVDRIRLPPYRSQFKYYFATDNRGDTYFNLDTLLIRFTTKSGQHRLDQLPGSHECRSLFIDRSEVLWMGTNGNGIRKYNLRAAGFDARPYRKNFLSDVITSYLGVTPVNFPGFPVIASPYLFRHTFDKKNHIWFNAGTLPFYRMDLSTGQCTPISFPTTLNSGELNQGASLATDPDGLVWAIYNSLVVYYQAGQWKQFPFSIQSKVGLPVNQLVVDRQALWLATVSNGLYRVDRTTGRVQHYASKSGDPSSLSSHELIGLFTDPLDNNLLWIGTLGSGLCRFDKRTGRCRRLTTQHGLPNNVVYSAIPDRRGGVWVGTNQGLSRVDRHTFRIHTYTQEDGLQADEFNRFHTLHLVNDRIILGGVDGITAFDPAQIREDTYQPPIQLTTLAINNKPFQPIRDSLPVHAMQELDLAHDQNFITVGFAAMQYNRQTKIRYRYRLEGLNSDWVYSDRPVAEYTGLRPGSYLLRLNATNTSWHWSPHVRTLRIVIHAPWWATYWAYACYGLLVLGVGYGLTRQYRNRILLQQSVAFKQKEAAQLREVDAIKTRFFTNITHEFRTPLTLILTPVEQMMQEDRSTSDHRRLTVIDRNAHQLLGLINQLLELSRLESGNLTVSESRGAPGELIEERINGFITVAETKGIQLTYQNQDAGEYWFDASKLERIVYNLVANALKFTPPGGTITVTLTPGIRVTVTDTGKGIPADKLAHIFNRFYQVDDPSKPEAQPVPADSSREHIALPAQTEGTGLGLALVKELVDIQGGSVQVESQPGAGSTFTVQLPYRPVTNADAVIVPVLDMLHEIPKVGEIHASVSLSEETPTLLVVEDNPELGAFIGSSLPATYRVHQATNGLQGLEKALHWMPDLIISDVMMPGMDGFALCSKLKEDPRTSHIPVILLTARAAMDSRLHGLALGADDYLAKPFHLEELRLRVGNQLERQRRYREKTLRELMLPGGPVTVAESPGSDPFLNQLYQLLDSHLDDSGFGVDELAAQAHLSRQHLHRKLKVLTGLSPSDFIRNFRLKRATRLLAAGQLISQAAYAVGFESPAYFTRSFRQLYGMTPSDYVNQHR